MLPDTLTLPLKVPAPETVTVLLNVAVDSKVHSLNYEKNMITATTNLTLNVTSSAAVTGIAAGGFTASFHLYTSDAAAERGR